MYVVMYSLQGRSGNVTTTGRSVQLRNLPMGATYQISVLAISELGEGPRSELKIATSPSGEALSGGTYRTLGNFGFPI